MKLKTTFLFVAILAFTCAAQAVTIDLVPVGNPGNAPDTRYAMPGYGAVNYIYQIGKYEITNAQWREFLTAKASLGDPFGLYSAGMSGDSGGIARSGLGTPSDPYVYSAKGGDANWDNRPVNVVSFWDAARFANWLHNGQGNGDTESGAYINIGNQSMFARLSGAMYFIPTENEWYKAAYHKNDGVTGNYFDYPTGSDSEPSNDLLTPDGGNNANFNQGDYYGYTIGSPYYMTNVGEFENSESPYGTFDQGGNLWEWNEMVITSSSRGLRGGDWAGSSNFLAASYRSDSPLEGSSLVGFRVASVPEPGSITLLICGAIAGLIWWRRRK
ncbi:MAG TPA: SUMF1/EgtB/PvdO family nonheme iron enzyme [Thermoguttaceae bacterium]